MIKILQRENSGYISKHRNIVPKKSLGNGLKLFLLSFTLLLFSFTASASHFRYGNISWTRISETSTTSTIQLNVSTSWRLGAAPGSIYFAFSGGPTSGGVSIPTTVTIDPSGGWSNAVGSQVITLQKSSTPYLIAFNGGNKIGGLQNNNGGYWNVFTIVNTNAPGSSPVSTLPAVINMPVGVAAATYTIPASDPDANATLSYRFATPSEMAGAYAAYSPVTQPSGLSINPTTGQLTFNTVGKSPGQLYNAGVVVTDNDGNQIFLDFLINITNFSNPPVFDYTTTPANGTTFNVIVGQNLSFPIKATDTDAGSTVSLSASGLPNYITTSNFSPAFPATGNPSQTTFSYTPGVAQIGSTIVLNFIATDNVGVQSSTSVTVKVVAEPAPTFTAQTLAQNSITQIQTGVPFSTNIEAVSSLGSNVSIGFSTGVPASASLSPTIPTAGANPGLTQLSWTPQPSDFGQKNLSFTAQITNIPTIFAVRNFSLIVNTPPVFTSIPPVTEVLFNTPFTYNITTSDLDIPYGDVVKIETLGLPSWLTLTSTGNGTATLSGTPSITDGGTYHIKLEAADTYHHGNPTAVIQEFDLKVTVCNTDLTSTTVKTSCPSSADGSIDLSVSGGKAPFTFAWSNGSTTEDISGLAAGNYSVTVTDANSCIATSTITIIAGIDSTAPVAPLLADVTGQCSVTVTNTPTTTDNCAGIINGTTTSPLTFAAQGNYVIVWKFDDGNGNITTANQNVIVKDDTKPVFVTVNNVSVSTSPTTNNALVTVPTPIVTDNCEKPTGNSLAFDGVDDIVAVSQGLPSMTEMTIETWLKPKELSNWDVIMNYNTFNIGDVHFQFFPNKTLEFSVAGNNPTDQFTTATFDDEKWYHFAAVYSSVGKYVKFYLNGNLIDTRTYTSAIATAANKAFSIGGWAPGNRYFNGNLDDLRIWNVARTAEQIKVSMNSTLQGNEIGLLAYYDFNQGIAGGNNSGVTSVTDLAGGNNSGVLQNFALNGNISNWVNGAPTTGINLVNDFNNSSDASGTYQAGSTIVNWTATDAAGNKASTQQTVTVIDSVKPIVITKNITVQLNASGNVGITPVQVNNGTTDNSGNFTLSLDKANFDCSNLGANLVTLTATDANGNTSTNTNPSGLIGLWDFKNANPLKDQTGNWGDLLVTGNASISNGKLDVNNGGMARTTSYTGATIGNKTLISYLSLDDLNLRAGSALTIDKINSDAFDGIIYAEGQPNRWMNGSSNALRYQALNPGFAESKANQLIQVALTYEMQPNNQVLIKFYRNGIAYGSYTSNNFQTWSANDAEMIFGARHFFNNTQIGSLDAKIEKAMIFNRALSIQEIQQLNTIVTVEDKIAPIIASKPISVTLTASGTVNITPQDVLLSGTDNCSGTITYTLSRSTFGATDAINSPVTVQLTGTDVSGNATSVPVLVTVIDPVPVVLTKNITVALGTNGSLTITPQQIDNGSSSVVGLATEGGLVLDKTTFDCSNIGVNTVKLTVTSSLGSTAFATAIVTVIDTIKPIVLTQNKTIQLNAAGAASITAADIDNGSTDNCKIATVVLSKTAFDCSNVGANTATLTVTDVNGNVSTKDAVITVEDKVAPTVFTQNRTIQLNGSGNATITAADINNGSTDNCGIATVVLSKTSFDCSNYGANTVTLTVTDIHGNVSTKTATVTVEDNVSPIVLTQNKTIQLNGSGQATITAADINNGSTDNCAIATVTLSKTSFDCSNYGANTVTLTVTDIHGNVSSKDAVVTVEDKVAPIVLTQNKTIQLDAAGTASITAADINNGSTDNCGIATVVLSKTAFDCSNYGANTVTLTVTDIHGNVATKTATVTVEDKVAPIVLVQNKTIQLNGSGQATITAADINNGSTDNCAIATVTLSKTSFDCSNYGANTVTLTVTDIHGNVSSKDAVVTVEDKVAPIVLTQNKTIQLDAAGTASITAADINNGSTDNCGIATVVLSKTAFDCSNYGANTVTLTVTDIHGNVASKTATVTVEDKVAPIVITQNLSIPLSGGTATITAAQINNGSTDNCGIASMTIDKTSFDCSTIGNHTVTLTVTDIHGNVASKTATVTIVGELTSSSIASVPTSATYTGGVSTNLYLGYGAQSTTLQVSNIVVGGNGTNPKTYTYAWSGSAVSQLSSTTSGAPIFTPTAGGYYTFNVLVTNKYGCTSAATISICVKDIREVDKKGKYTGKVYICHAPPGNIGNTNTLSISVNAVGSHLSQHSYDRLGSCEDAPCSGTANVMATNSSPAISAPTKVENTVITLHESELMAYPNPFGRQTTVRFTLPYQENNATLEMFDLKGMKLQTLYKGNANSQTTYEVRFDGSQIAAGTYFFRLTTSQEVKNFKVIMTN